MKSSKTMLIMSFLFCFISVLPLSAFAGPVPDTGQTKCYDDTGEILSCPVPGGAFYGQDSSYSLNTPSYTKLDADGNDLPDNAASWTMVRDNVTGLIWEAKEPKDNRFNYFNPHDSENVYCWYDPNPATNGGDLGKQGDGDTSYDTQMFLNALNTAKFGGHNDWRLPTIIELLSLIDYSIPYDPNGLSRTINTVYFPSAAFSYWSSTSEGPPITNHAWSVSLTGWVNISQGSKASNNYVMAVRGGQPEPLDHFVDNRDGTVTDTFTGLMWQQETPDDKKIWEDALLYCERHLSLAGYDDWRLPTVTELESIRDFRIPLPGPLIDTIYFSDTEADQSEQAAYWSSTTSAYTTSNAWDTRFWSDSSFNRYKCDDRYNTYVRAVRSGQSGSLDHPDILAPKQASELSIGALFPIRWETDGLGANVKISLSRQGGLTVTFVETIIESTANDGYYEWTITGPASVNCVIKIEQADNSDNWATEGLFLITIDTDADGLPDSLEIGCTNPSDADTDDDGVIDGDEDAYYDGIMGPGETDPCNVDTDSDGIRDGTELGYTLDDIGADTDQNVFKPDVDDTTTTNPRSRDTDGDGAFDGTEDANRDGMMDGSETDPNLINFTPTGRIPETGQTKCYNNATQVIPCPSPGEPFYGQDASYTINPMSCTKLDADENDLPDNAVSWTMVRDNVTGLIWEAKTDDGSIHDKDNLYSWYDPGHGGSSGPEGEISDTYKFLKALNVANYGGHNDWRLPTIHELMSIVNYGIIFPGPTINRAFFPNTAQNIYWSSTDDETNRYNSVWGVYFTYPYILPHTKFDHTFVRAVRGGQSGSSDHLIINDDKTTVTDTNTGLMWQQETPDDKKTWEKALSYCEDLTLAGYDDWRLPTTKEIMSNVDYSQYAPAIDTTIFPDTVEGQVGSYYWTSTTSTLYPNSAWNLHFYIGQFPEAHVKNENLHNVRAVRGGQTGSLDHLVILEPKQASQWRTDDNSVMPIRWNTDGLGDDVKISLSRQGGLTGTFGTLIASTPNDGYYEWPVTGPKSFNCVLKIEQANDLSKWATEGFFVICDCNFTIDPESMDALYYVDYCEVAVNASFDSCEWTAMSSLDWIGISEESGIGDSTVGVGVAYNDTCSDRTGTMTIAGQTFTVTQPAGDCDDYTINPESARFTCAASIGNTIAVTAIPACCPWTATTIYNWITITGTGNGTVTYDIAENCNSTPRSGNIIVAGRTFRVYQAEVVCDTRWFPTSASVNGAASTGNTIAVTTSLGCCYWNANSTETWITITEGQNGQGSSTVKYDVAANPYCYTRYGDIYIQGQVFSVKQAPATCTYLLDPPSASFDAYNHTGNKVYVLPSNGCCFWMAEENLDWITITGGISGTGYGTVTYNVAANTTCTERSGDITIGGQTFTVTQSASACTYGLSPTSTWLGADASTGNTVAVSPSCPNCPWTANESIDWITIMGGDSGTGYGMLTYDVAANTTCTERSGDITIAGQTFWVDQEGVSCAFGLSPESASVGAAGVIGNTVIVDASFDCCSWWAESDSDWITITDGTNGEGDGPVTYNVSANTTPLSRTGTILVTTTGNTFYVTVTQAGNTATLTGLSISGSASVNENSTATYTATARWGDGSTTAVTPIWSVNSAYASISADGALTTIELTRKQTVTITASYTSGGVTKSATTSVIILDVKLIGLSISGPASVKENSAATYTAIARWSHGLTTIVTPIWSVNSAYASINAAGELTTMEVTRNQTVKIKASYTSGGVTKSATKSVTIINGP